MIVATSNIVSQATVTAVPESTLQDIAVITDGDFSSVYSDALQGTVEFKFVFPVPTAVGYIAIGGSNIGRKAHLKITASDAGNPIKFLTSNLDQFVTSNLLDFSVTFEDAIDDSDLGLNESPVMMYALDMTGVVSISITVEGAGNISIAEIAMGDYYTIPRGEQGGYNRPWSVPNIIARSSTGLNNAPVNLSYESRALRCNLSVPNNIMADFDGWYNFINYAANNTFYILEDDNKFHSYACFNASPSMTAAGSQKGQKLGVSSISFNAFAKSTEALF
jgi:hypothetical protein